MIRNYCDVCSKEVTGDKARFGLMFQAAIARQGQQPGQKQEGFDLCQPCNDEVRSAFNAIVAKGNPPMKPKIIQI